jgi:hypothetical protein
VNQYVADTHALHWYLIASPLLGPSADRAFGEGSAGHAQIDKDAVIPEMHDRIIVGVARRVGQVALPATARSLQAGSSPRFGNLNAAE